MRGERATGATFAACAAAVAVSIAVTVGAPSPLPRAAAQPGAAAQELPSIDARPLDEARTFAAGGVSETAIVAALANAHPDRFRAIGTTSLTFHADLAGSIDAAFKPESRLHPRGWLAEVAAFRIARELGLDSVPPAVLRRVDRGLLRRRLEPSRDGATLDDIASELVFTGPGVRGAFIYWVPGLQRTDLDTPDGIARWSEWLRQGGVIPEGQRSIARDVSSALVFDYVIGNRDRWSGGNISLVEGGRVVIRDHNLAFPYVLVEGVHRRMLESLRRAQRFSRRTIARLAAMDEHALRAAVADHDPESLLDDRQIAHVLQRRETVLTYVGALIEIYGEDAVLFFR